MRGLGGHPQKMRRGDRVHESSSGLSKAKVDTTEAAGISKSADPKRGSGLGGTSRGGKKTGNRRKSQTQTAWENASVPQRGAWGEH